jgi:DNA-binding GntR family transcriptional regulator
VPAVAALFGVSATPAREAVLDLVARGFVEAVRNKGFRVTAVSDEALAQVAQARSLIEPVWMARIAAEFPSERLPEFRRMADRIVAGARAGDLIAYLQADQEFHLELTALGANPLVVQIVADLRDRARLFGLTAMVAAGTLVASAHEHHELLDLLAAGDGPGAQRLMERHIAHTLGEWAGRSER